MKFDDYVFESKSDITALADCIRTKTGKTGELTVPQMKIAIDGLYMDNGIIDRTIQTVVIPKWLSAIGLNAFANCSKLVNVRFETDTDGYSALTLIREYAFQWCTSLSKITLPNSVETIGTSAFKRCTSLTAITLPASIQYVYEKAFQYCASLNTVTFKETPKQIGLEVFIGCPNLTDIYVPWSKGKFVGEETCWGAKYATIHYNS